MSEGGARLDQQDELVLALRTYCAIVKPVVAEESAIPSQAVGA